MGSSCDHTKKHEPPSDPLNPGTPPATALKPLQKTIFSDPTPLGPLLGPLCMLHPALPERHKQLSGTASLPVDKAQTGTVRRPPNTARFFLQYAGSRTDLISRVIPEIKVQPPPKPPQTHPYIPSYINFFCGTGPHPWPRASGCRSAGLPSPWKLCSSHRGPIAAAEATGASSHKQRVVLPARRAYSFWLMTRKLHA